MKIFLLLIFSLFFFNLNAQTSKDYSVLLSAVVQKSPPRITLNWNYHAGATSYNIYRKVKTDNSWGSPIANLTGSDTTYQDNNVTVGTGYEYRVEKAHPSLTASFNSAYNGAGKTNNFIYSGIELSDNLVKGKLILVIDSSIYDSIKLNINLWILDAELEGWDVSTLKVSRLMTAENVKTFIVNEYQKDPSNTKSVFIVGHVPVPYSGAFKAASGSYTPPDAHPDHVAAWPADVYYGDMDGNWSDNTVDDSTGSRKANWNLIGDGKWDVTNLEYNLPELQVGRVDFANMPAFSKSEVQLLNDYLVKCHNYKTAQYKPLKRGLIDDNFGSFSGESFASSGWNNISSLLGKGSVTLCDTVNKYDYITTMDTASYMWSYGCGAGGYNSCSGIGSSTNLASKNIKTVFTMMFGSYFGDWDSQNNILRATIASGTTLSCVWSGRPRWYFHHMGLGETLGYATVLSQSNSGAFSVSQSGYPSFNSGGLVHTALMGDPSLRMNYVAPPSNLSVTLLDSAHISLSWSASSESVLGYNVYRKSVKLTDNVSNWVKLNKSNLTTLQFTDSCVTIPDSFIYQIRAVKLETTGSGTYLNESISVRDTIYIGFSNKTIASFTVTNTDPKFDFVNTSKNAKSYKWTFNDTTLTSSTADVSRTYKKNGTYWVLLTTAGQCSQDTQKVTIKVSKVVVSPPLVNSISSNTIESLTIYPNPFAQKIEIQAANNGLIMFFDIQGKLLLTKDIHSGFHSLDLGSFEKGIYILKFGDQDGQFSEWTLVKE